MPTSTPSGFALIAIPLLLVLGACSSSDEMSDTPLARSSAGIASPSEAGEPLGEYVPAFIGTWDYEFDRAERRVILDDFAGLVDGADRVVVRLAFVNENVWWLGFLFDGNCPYWTACRRGTEGPTPSTETGSAP